MNTYVIRSTVEIKLDAFSASDAADATRDALGEIETIGAELVAFEVESIRQE